MNLTDINDGLVAALRTITSLHVFDFEPVTPTAPCVFPTLPETGLYHETFDDQTGGLTWSIRLLVPWTNSRGAYDQIQPYLATTGADSIKAAIEDDSTLGGAVSDLSVVGWSGLGRYGYGTVDYLGVDVNILVIA